MDWDEHRYFIISSVLISSPINAICDDSFFASIRVHSRFLDFSLVPATLQPVNHRSTGAGPDGGEKKAWMAFRVAGQSS
jgi:hypothetical protein